jgi:signal transduction histidine kinase
LYGELAASRARIVAGADQTRRRIEQDLHDGAQQRLVSLALRIRTTQTAQPSTTAELTAQLDSWVSELTSTLEELRELARGIHPAGLTDGGLNVALETLAHRSAVPVELSAGLDERPPDHIEVAAYYVVSEALTNIAKHAQASIAHVEVGTNLHCGTRLLWVEVRDDGRGGAAFTRGTGLLGLKDRVEAVGGRIILDSLPQAGTTIRAEFPFTSADAPPALHGTLRGNFWRD